jgi:large subunit ribosomal protein L13e
MQEEERKVAVQLAAKQIMPIKQTVIKHKARVITGAEKKFSAYHALTKVSTEPIYFAALCLNILEGVTHECFLFQARADAKLIGKRAKRAKEAAENAEDITKKKK